MFKVTVSALGMDTEVHRISGDEVTIGRGSSNSLPLEGIGISRRHCRAFVRAGQVWVEDLGSTNGTVIAGKTLEGAVLVPDDTPVDVGERRVVFRFTADDAPAEPAERTVAMPAAPEPAPPPSSAAVARVIEEVRTERHQQRSTLARSKVAQRPVDRRAAISAVRRSLDQLFLDAAAAQFERELRANAPPSDAALDLLERMLAAEVQAMNVDD